MVVVAEPLCCGEPMVHNSFTGQYECAVAYFTLVDEGWGEGALARATEDEVGADLAPVLLHWRASCRPDGWDEP